LLGLLVSALAVAGPSLATANPTKPHWQVFATRVPNLVDVDARSSSDVWAAGDGVVHWDGHELHTWRVPGSRTVLRAISAESPVDVWVVGEVAEHASAGPTVVAHWDGDSWHRVALPAGNLHLLDITAPAPDDVWAAGYAPSLHSMRPLLLHWDGARWHRVNLLRIAAVQGQLNAIDARGPNDVWAAGMDGNWAEESYGYLDYVVHWDGRRWQRVTSPLEDEFGSGPFAQALDVGLNGDVWTLDYDLSANGPFFVRWAGPRRTARAYRWDTNVDDEYEDIASISATDAWLVGSRIAHWNGARWRNVPTPYSHAHLYGISAVAADDIWAVGNHLIAHYGR
jgi:hypothetical protein